MYRNPRVFAPLIALAACAAAFAQPGPRNRIDVQDVTIDADISPAAESITAKATVRFIPLDDGITWTTFELNNGLSVSKVEDSNGKQLQASRSQQDFSIRVTFEQPLPKDKPCAITFYYDGKLGDERDSPVYGVKFAGIHADFGYLTYPARWFPVSGYTTDRFAADIKVAVPMGYSVLGVGSDSKTTQADKNIFEYKFDHPSFPGSVAIVKGQPAKVQSGGVTTAVYFRGDNAAYAQNYGETVDKMMAYFSDVYGPAPALNLNIVETEPNAPTGYAAPGLIFLAPGSINAKTNEKVLANQVGRQWWEELVSPATRNHLWIENGMAAYSELLWTEQSQSAAAAQSQLRDVMVEALTVDQVPVGQAARLDDYSPELWALSGSKAAVILEMLRGIMGEDKFHALLKDFPQKNKWKSVNTDDFQKAAEAVMGSDMGYFFIQWIESSNAPEFKLEYTVYRTQKGFRVMGKISQDLDTFRMPVALRIETEGNPETQTVEVMGTSSEFSVDTFGKPKNIVIDPDGKVLRFSPDIRVAVAIRRGEQFAQLSQFPEALKEYQKALETNRTSSLANYRIGEVYLLEGQYQDAANKFRAAIDGDLTPKWTEVWSHINLGNVYDISGQRDRAVNEYNLALRTKDNTANAIDKASSYIKAPYQREKKPDDR